MIVLPGYCAALIGSSSETQVTNYQPNTASFQKSLIANYSVLPLLKQFHSPVLNQFCSNGINTWIFKTFIPFRSHLKLRGTRFRYEWPQLHVFFSLPKTIKPTYTKLREVINPLNPELNPICYLLALLGAHHFLHVSRIRVKLLTFGRLMSYIYGAPILHVCWSLVQKGPTDCAASLCVI